MMTIKRLILAGLLAFGAAVPVVAEQVTVTIADTLPSQGLDGRVILIFSKDGSSEPRFQVQRGFESAQIFGQDVENLKAGEPVRFGTGIIGYPLTEMAAIPAGRYTVQAVLHKYDTYRLAAGKTVKLPAARGAGQNCRREPGNLISNPVTVDFAPDRAGNIAIALTVVLPPIAAPADTEFTRYFKFRSPSLSQF